MNEFKFTTEYEKLINQRNVNLDLAKIAMTKAVANNKLAEMLWRGQMEKDPVASAETQWSSLPPIRNVIKNPPATIVYWDDGTKTVVKCMEGDTFDPEKGLAMAVCKRLWGQKGEGADYIHVFRKYAKQAPKSEEKSLADAFKKLAENLQARVPAINEQLKRYGEERYKEADIDDETVIEYLKRCGKKVPFGVSEVAEEVTQIVKNGDEPKQKPWDEIVKGLD